LKNRKTAIKRRLPLHSDSTLSILGSMDVVPPFC
jgi:hypothetical protein